MTGRVRPVALSAAVFFAGFAGSPAVGDVAAQATAKAPAAKPAQTARPTARPATKPAAPAKSAPDAPKPAAALPPPPPSDVKIVTSYTQDAQVFQNTTYLKGGRQRVEFVSVVSLDQCDLQRTVMLNPAEKRFRVQPYVQPSTASAPAADTTAPPSAAPARGGVVTLTTTLTDTMERQTMFGLEARRIKTVVAKTADANACDKDAARSEIDAWYVDLPKASTASCARQPAALPEPAPAAGACRDRVETRTVGDVALGFPVKTTTTVVTGEGDKQETASRTVEVTSLEITTLDAALFDVPADYTEAKNSQELMPGLAAGGSLEDALFGSTADGTSQAAPKKAGVIRIGVLEPVDKSGRHLNTRALRSELSRKFSKGYEALPLSGSSVPGIEADARRLDCDYILLAEITELKSSAPGKFGGMLKMASGGGPPKEVHEARVSYKLFAIGATSSPRASGDVKASSGGGFGIGSALRVASFAGQMYLSLYGVRGGLGMFGMNMGMNPLSAVASMGGLGGSYFDPRATAVTSMAGMGTSPDGSVDGLPDSSQGELYQTVDEALGNIPKAATEKIKTAK